MENELKKLVGKKDFVESLSDTMWKVLQRLLLLIWAIFDLTRMRGVNSIMRTTREISSMATTI